MSAPAKTKAAAKPTRYEVSRRVSWSPASSTDVQNAWLPVATVEATGARAALRQHAESLGDKFTGDDLRAIPVSNITQVEAKVETQRKLTLG